jgi:hypothetical protein
MRNSRRLALLEDVQIHGRAIADVYPRQELSLPPSGQSQETRLGGKCMHGVYIPAAYLWTERSPYCSICHPYEIISKSTFLA